MTLECVRTSKADMLLIGMIMIIAIAMFALAWGAWSVAYAAMVFAGFLFVSCSLLWGWSLLVAAKRTDDCEKIRRHDG